MYITEAWTHALYDVYMYKSNCCDKCIVILLQVDEFNMSPLFDYNVYVCGIWLYYMFSFVSRSVVSVSVECSADLLSLGGEYMTMCIVHNVWCISKCGGLSSFPD